MLIYIEEWQNTRRFGWLAPMAGTEANRRYKFCLLLNFGSRAKSDRANDPKVAQADGGLRVPLW